MLKTKRLPHVRAYFREVRRGTLFYDEEYRHPSDPPGPAHVNCIETHRVGVTFLVQRSTALWDEPVNIQFIWKHSEIDSDDASGNHYKKLIFHRGDKAKIFSGGVILTDELKVDGIVWIRAKINDREIVENSFLLIGCPKANSDDNTQSTAFGR